MVKQVDKLIKYLEEKNPVFSDLVYFFDRLNPGEYGGIDDGHPRQMYIRFQDDISSDEIEIPDIERPGGCDHWESYKLYLVIASTQCFNVEQTKNITSAQLYGFGGVKINSISFDAEKIYKDETSVDNENNLRNDYMSIARFAFTLTKPISLGRCGNQSICTEECC